MINVKLGSVIYYALISLTTISCCVYLSAFLFPFVGKRVISSFASVQSHIFCNSKATPGISLVQANGNSLTTPHLTQPHFERRNFADYAGDELLPEEEKGSPIRRVRAQKQQPKNHAQDPMSSSPHVSADPLQTSDESPVEPRIPTINAEDDEDDYREETVEGLRSTVDQGTEDPDTEFTPVKLKDSQVDTTFDWNLEDDDIVIYTEEGSLAAEKAREIEASVAEIENEEEIEIDYSCLGTNGDDIATFFWYMEKKLLKLAKREADALKLLEGRGKMDEYEQKSRFYVNKCNDVEFAFSSLRPPERSTQLGPKALKSLVDNFCQYCLAKLELFFLPEKILYCSFLEELITKRTELSNAARAIKTLYEEKMRGRKENFDSVSDITSIDLEVFPNALKELSKKDQEEIGKILGAANQIKEQMKQLGSVIQIKEDTSPRKSLMRLQSVAQIEEDIDSRSPLQRKVTY